MAELYGTSGHLPLMPAALMGHVKKPLAVRVGKVYRPPLRRERAAQRRWPSGISSFRACCLSAPTVRFINLEIFATGVLAFE
jgi:hypothetical protein